MEQIDTDNLIQRLVEQTHNTSTSTALAPRGLKGRIEQIMNQEEAQRDSLLANVAAVEKRITLLKSLSPFVDDPDMEGVLQALVPQADKRVYQKHKARIPGNRATFAIDVSRSSVMTTARSFERTFSINDLMDRMVGGKILSDKEHKRVRAAIHTAMVTLAKYGYLMKEQQGIGSSPTLWRRLSA